MPRVEARVCLPNNAFVFPTCLERGSAPPAQTCHNDAPQQQRIRTALKPRSCAAEDIRW